MGYRLAFSSILTFSLREQGGAGVVNARALMDPYFPGDLVCHAHRRKKMERNRKNKETSKRMN